MMKIDDLRIELEGLNQELAQLTGRSPLVLHYQTGNANEDTLFLYGIIGGKDVGKTSLINLLAGSRISIDTDILDEGTRKAVAYCHREDQASLQKRLGTEMSERVELVSHERDILRNVVLVDFPDYDSRFQEHREDVRRLSRFLQGLVWVITPRKYGDHEFVDQLEAVAQSHENYLIILNKTDQLEGRVDLESARREVLGYLKEECTRRNISSPTGDRLLMVSALSPDRYEYPRLYERLVRRHSPEEILKAKVKNLRTEFNKNLDTLRAHYALTDRIAELDEALDEIALALHDHFDNEYFQTVWQRVLSLGTIQHRISQGLFFRRVQDWPLLRLLFYPLAGVISFVGGRFVTQGTGETVSESPRDILRRQGQSASALLQSIRIEIEERHPDLISYLEESPDFAPLVEKNFRRLIENYEDRVVQRISSAIPRPGTWKKSLVYLPLLWFPFLQPFLLDIARSDESISVLSGIQKLFAILISLLGAGALLESVIFLLVFYLIWLVILYARGARRAFLVGEEEFQCLWFETFISQLAGLLNRPFETVRSGWQDKQARLERIQADMEAEMKRIELY